MRADNVADWQRLCADLEADGPIGQDFRRFVERWMDVAEDNYVSGDASWRGCAADVVRVSLAEVESEKGRISSDYLFQMLVVIISFWEHGQQVADDLTPFELRAVQDVLAMKLSALEDEAVEISDPIDEVESDE